MAIIIPNEQNEKKLYSFHMQLSIFTDACDSSLEQQNGYIMRHKKIIKIYI